MQNHAFWSNLSLLNCGNKNICLLFVCLFDYVLVIILISYCEGSGLSVPQWLTSNCSSEQTVCALMGSSPAYGW